MDLSSLHKYMAQLSSYVTESQRRQQAGLSVDKELLHDAEQILRRLSIIASIPPLPPAKSHN